MDLKVPAPDRTVLVEHGETLFRRRRRAISVRSPVSDVAATVLRILTGDERRTRRLDALREIPLAIDGARRAGECSVAGRPTRAAASSIAAVPTVAAIAGTAVTGGAAFVDDIVAVVILTVPARFRAAVVTVGVVGEAVAAIRVAVSIHVGRRRIAVAHVAFVGTTTAVVVAAVADFLRAGEHHVVEVVAIAAGRTVVTIGVVVTIAVTIAAAAAIVV